MKEEKETREFYRRKIIEMVGRINNESTLKYIYKVISTYLKSRG